MQEAAGNGAQLVVLPEMWNCPYSNDSFPTYAGESAPVVLASPCILGFMLAILACNTLPPPEMKLSYCNVCLRGQQCRVQSPSTPDAARFCRGSHCARMSPLPMLPRACLCYHTLSEDIDGGSSPSTSMLSEAATAHRVTLVGGSVPERSNGKLYNTCCVYDNTGKLLAKHRCVYVTRGLMCQVAMWTVLLGSAVSL